MKVPGRRQERQGGHPFGPPGCQGQGQKPAHAIPHHQGRPAGGGEDLIGGRFKPPANIIREAEPAFVGARHAPIKEKRSKSVGRQMPQEAPFLGQIQDVAAVDQRRHHQYAGSLIRRWPGFRSGSGGGAVIQHPCRAVTPKHRRLGRPGGAGVVTVTGDTFAKRQEPSAGLGVDGGGKGEAVRVRRLKVFLQFCGGFF